MSTAIHVPEGFRLWHLGQGTKGEWQARLYRWPRDWSQLAVSILEEDDFLATGHGETPQDAIDACFTGKGLSPTSRAANAAARAALAAAIAENVAVRRRKRG